MPEGRLTVTAHGREQTALKAWRQVTATTNAQIVVWSGLSDRTVTAAIAGGAKCVSGGSAALLEKFTGIASTVIIEGAQRNEWTMIFSGDKAEVLP